MTQPDPNNRTEQTNGGPRWYALLTQARHEKRVRDRLRAEGVQPFLPTLTRLSQWKDRKQQIEEPLFSCYCFAQFPW